MPTRGIDPRCNVVSPTPATTSTATTSATAAMSTVVDREPVIASQPNTGTSTAMNDPWPSKLKAQGLSMIGVVTPYRANRRAKSTADGAEPTGTTVRITCRCNCAETTSGYGTAQPSRHEQLQLQPVQRLGQDGEEEERDQPLELGGTQLSADTAKLGSRAPHEEAAQ